MSRRIRCTIRGENCPIASWTTTIVMVSTSAARLTIETAIVFRIAVAEVGRPTSACGTEQDVARAEAAVRKIEDCDHRLGKYRAALDAGADATVVAGWMAEVQGEKLRAEQDLLRSKPVAAFDAEAIRGLIEELGPMAEVMAGASYEAKAELYNSLGLELTFDAGQKVVTVEAAPVYSRSCRRGDYPHTYTRAAGCHRLGVTEERGGPPVLCSSVAGA